MAGMQSVVPMGSKRMIFAPQLAFASSGETWLGGESKKMTSAKAVTPPNGRLM